MACENCRAKKIRCDRARPQCRHCDQRSLRCVYINERHKRRKLSESEIENRFRQLESLVELQAGLTTSRENRIDTNNTAPACTQGRTNSSTPARGSGSPGKRWQSNNVPDFSYLQDAGNTLIHEELQSGQDGNETHGGTNLGTSLSPGQTVSNSIPFGTQPSPDLAIWLRPSDGDEYTGPSSGISLLSTEGLRWTQETLGQAQTLPLSVFEDLRSNLLGHLRLPKCMTDDSWVFCGGREYPAATEVWRYVNAYFDSVQTIFPILDKQQLVQRTAAHLASPVDTSPSWNALFYAVLASGCRAALANETPNDFRDSGREAWGFFKEAVAMESQLIHRSTDLMAVQAFAVMTVYAQGMASPQRLEYTLCSIAARLSQTLGLHRHAPSEWNLTNEERCERNKTFWIVYCLDKTIALRCGRPCIFDDDDISCDGPIPCGMTVVDCAMTSHEMPTPPPFNFLLRYTELAKICGIAGKHLYSARALRKSCQDLVHLATLLLSSLEVWRQNLPKAVQPSGPLQLSALRAHMSLEQGLSLHLGYYYAICAIHRRFTPLFQYPGESFRFEAPIETLSFMEAARKMILLTKHLDIESYTPAWLLFYYPMTALLAVFTHVICNPTQPSAKNDIALMEVVVGFFGRLEFLTSGVTAFTKTGEIVRQARSAVDRACEGRTLQTADLSPLITTMQTAENSHTELGESVLQQAPRDCSILDYSTFESGPIASQSDQQIPLYNFEELFNFDDRLLPVEDGLDQLRATT